MEKHQNPTYYNIHVNTSVIKLCEKSRCETIRTELILRYFLLIHFDVSEVWIVGFWLKIIIFTKGFWTFNTFIIKAESYLNSTATPTPSAGDPWPGRPSVSVSVWWTRQLSSANKTLLHLLSPHQHVNTLTDQPLLRTGKETSHLTKWGKNDWWCISLKTCSIR